MASRLCCSLPLVNPSVHWLLHPRLSRGLGWAPSPCTTHTRIKAACQLGRAPPAEQQHKVPPAAAGHSLQSAHMPTMAGRLPVLGPSVTFWHLTPAQLLSSVMRSQGCVSGSQLASLSALAGSAATKPPFQRSSSASAQHSGGGGCEAGPAQYMQRAERRAQRPRQAARHTRFPSVPAYGCPPALFLHRQLPLALTPAPQPQPTPATHCRLQGLRAPPLPPGSRLISPAPALRRRRQGATVDPSYRRRCLPLSCTDSRAERRELVPSGPAWGCSVQAPARGKTLREPQPSGSTPGLQPQAGPAFRQGLSPLGTASTEDGTARWGTRPGGRRTTSTSCPALSFSSTRTQPSYKPGFCS